MFRLIIISRKAKNTSFDMQSYLHVSHKKLKWQGFYVSLYFVAKAKVGNYIAVGFALWLFVSKLFHWLKLLRNYMSKLFCTATGWVILKNVVVNHAVNRWWLTNECCHFTLSLWKSMWILEANTCRRNVKHDFRYILVVFFLINDLFGMFFLPVLEIIW